MLTDLKQVVKRATSFLISTRFATVLQDKLHFFVACLTEACDK